MNKRDELKFLLDNPHLKVDTNWVVITGAPSSGKTSLIDELGNRGYLTNPDISRGMIEVKMASGMTLEQIYENESAFQIEILCEMLENIRFLPKDHLIFHDYSLPDNIPFLKTIGIPILSEFLIAAKRYKFKKVFICSPLSLKMDGVRRETPADQLFLNEQIHKVYRELGYVVIDLPSVSIAERVEIILAHLPDSK